jgi:hypothetical protein
VSRLIIRNDLGLPFLVESSLSLSLERNSCAGFWFPEQKPS